MKVLIVSPGSNPQTEKIAPELAKNSIQTEIVDQLHPLRIILNRYDLVHFFEPQSQNSNKLQSLLQQFSQTVQSFFIHAVGLPTLMTFYDRPFDDELTTRFNDQFTALTASHIDQLKSLRTFQGEKMILPCLPNIAQSSLSPSENTVTDQPVLVIPVQNSFTDLLTYSKINFKTVCNHEIYVDARQLKTKMNNSQIRKAWQKFIKTQPGFSPFILFTSDDVFNDLELKHQLFILIANNLIPQTQITFWIESYLNFNSTLILDENQATGFSKFWKHKKNCFIVSESLSKANTQSELSEFINNNQQKQSSVMKKNLLSQCVDSKINELTRLYTKVIQQKTSLNHRSSAKMEV